jgi:hypothetical protein
VLECILVGDDESHSGWDMTVDAVNEVVGGGDAYIISPPTKEQSRSKAIGLNIVTLPISI